MNRFSINLMVFEDVTQKIAGPERDISFSKRKLPVFHLVFEVQRAENLEWIFFDEDQKPWVHNRSFMLLLKNS